MADEREVRKERDVWGNEREYVYEEGKRIGEIKTEERGGFFGIGGDTVRVEYDTSGKQTSYMKEEDRGGIFGIGAERQEIRYDTSDQEIGHSRVEPRGGFFGVGAHHVRVEYDNEGREVSQTNHERRGDFLGIGGQRVRVTRYAEKPAPDECALQDDEGSGRGGSTGAGWSDRDTTAGSGDEGEGRFGSARGLMVALLLAALAGGLLHLARTDHPNRGTQSAPSAAAAGQPASAVQPAPVAIDWGSPPRLTLHGLGPFHIGMSFSDAAAAHAGRLAREEGQVGKVYCALLSDGPEGLLLVFSEDRLVRIDVLSSDIASLRGARVGQAQESVLALYAGKLSELPSVDADGGRRFAFVPSDPGDRDLRMVFETDGRRVTGIRVGRIPEVQSPGRCS